MGFPKCPANFCAASTLLADLNLKVSVSLDATEVALRRQEENIANGLESV